MGVNKFSDLTTEEFVTHRPKFQLKRDKAFYDRPHAPGSVRYEVDRSD